MKPEVVDGGPWRGVDRRTWIHRILADGEEIPAPPPGYYRHGVGLTAHLRPMGQTGGRMVCGEPPGLPPRGEPIGICLDCWASAG